MIRIIYNTILKEMPSSCENCVYCECKKNREGFRWCELIKDNPNDNMDEKTHRSIECPLFEDDCDFDLSNNRTIDL